MAEDTGLIQAPGQYAQAYAAHYTERDLARALQLYRQLTASHANSPEAEYSREQLRNIVQTVVPKDELPEAQVELAAAWLARRGDP